jgi:hypothetical protein
MRNHLTASNESPLYYQEPVHSPMSVNTAKRALHQTPTKPFVTVSPIVPVHEKLYFPAPQDWNPNESNEEGS